MGKIHGNGVGTRKILGEGVGLGTVLFYRVIL